MSRSGSSKGSGLSSTPLMTLNIAAFAPMPIASVAAAMPVNRGVRMSRRPIRVRFPATKS
jgi:hypothetical protein